MTKIIITIIVLAIIGFGVWAVVSNDSLMNGNNGQNATSTDDAIAQDATGASSIEGSGTYVATASSSMMWEGRKILVPGYTDQGVINIKNGSLVLADGNIASGTFEIDMTTIAVESTGRGSGESNLTTHLKSDDFFDVAKYPTAKFTINSATPLGGSSFEVKGDLTLKGITQPIAFIANITQEDNMIVANAETELDRTLWDVRYGSGKFFDDLGDNIIGDTFKVTFNLVTEMSS